MKSVLKRLDFFNFSFTLDVVGFTHIPRVKCLNNGTLLYLSIIPPLLRTGFRTFPPQNKLLHTAPPIAFLIHLSLVTCKGFNIIYVVAYAARAAIIVAYSLL